MGVGVQHGVNQPDRLAEQLRAQIGGRINEQIAPWQARDGRTPRSLISGGSATTHRAAASNRRNTDGCSRAQEDKASSNVSALWSHYHEQLPSRHHIPPRLDKKAAHRGESSCPPNAADLGGNASAV